MTELDDREPAKISRRARSLNENRYRCYRCGYEWQDLDVAIPDDDCGTCGARHVAAESTVEVDVDSDGFLC